MYEQVFKNSLGGSERCILCRGTKLLCGKERCPILARYYSKTRVFSLIDSFQIEGASPPSVFVGRWGYPKVFVGPMLPPKLGDTSFMDTPEEWIDCSIDQFIDFRSQLIRGKYRIKVKDVETEEKIIQQTKEIAFSESPIVMDTEFEKKPRGRLVLSDTVQPYGPSAPLSKIEMGNLKWDQRVEKAHGDTDLKSKDAVFQLYNSKMLISKIQKAFSVGGFGIKKERRFVPTRWSITAVDSIVGQELVKEIKEFPEIDEYRVYEWRNLDNLWAVLFLPLEWCYELIEAWYPFTAWNPFGKETHIYSSHEFWKGRKAYAEIGGCYYAARLAVGETLKKERRQAGCVIFREVHPGYILPVGVWNVRENVRKTLTTKPNLFYSLNDALLYISRIMDIPVGRWVKNSTVLKHRIYQQRIEDFVKSGPNENLRNPL
jgi:hypothetical protein